ncbi:MAG: lysylphosphatidylglycerol synthase domain-containing protein [Bacilli bacterium]
MTVSKKTKSTLKTVFNIIFFVLLTFLALIYVLKDDPKTTFSLLSQANFFPLLLAIFVVIAANLLEGISITVLAKIYNPDYHYYQGLINAQIGAFVGCINKTSANFIQAYTFTKQDIKGENAASILTMNFLMYQLTLTLYSLVMVFVGYPFVKDVPLDLLGGMKIFPLSLIGFIIDAVCLALIFLLAWWKGLHRFVVNIGVRVLSALHIIKNPELTRKKWILKFTTYRIESKRLMKHFDIVIILFAINIVKQLLVNILPYICFWALGVDMSSLSFLTSLGASSYISLISSYLTMGAPEVAFQAIFSYILANGSQLEANTNAASSFASAGNILWRALTLYFNLIVGGLTCLLYKGTPKRYEIQSNTATIYDLELVNLSNDNDDSTKEFLRAVSKDKNRTNNNNEPILTEAEVEDSLKRIQKNMENNRQERVDEKPSSKEVSLTLASQKKQLAQALKESEAISKSLSLDPEIQKESFEELSNSEKFEEAHRLRKEKRKENKAHKRAERAKKKLEKLQPYGTTIRYDSHKGLDFEGPEMNEERTLTTSEPDNSDLDNQANKNTIADKEKK